MDSAQIWYEKGARRGNVNCMNSLGHIYSDRDGYGRRIVDKEKAFYWYHKAPETSSESQRYANSWAQCEVAECYIEGFGVGKNTDKVIFWLKKSAAQSNDGYRYGRALYFLGKCYEEGFGVVRDLQTAYNYYKEAEKWEEERLACRQLGLWYLLGIHVKQNYSTGIEYLIKSAENMDASICNLLGVAYQEVFYGLPKDEKKAFDYFVRSYCAMMSPENFNFDNYYPDNFMDLARCYALGIGCEVNIEKALRFYKLAADCNVEGATKAIELIESRIKDFND